MKDIDIKDVNWDELFNEFSFFLPLLLFLFVVWCGITISRILAELRDREARLNKNPYLSFLAKNPKLSKRKLTSVKQNISMFRHPSHGLRISNRKLDQALIVCVEIDEDHEARGLIGLIKDVDKIDPDRDIDTYLDLVRLAAMSHQARLAKNRRESQFYEKKAISKIIEQRLKIEKHQIIEKEKLAAEEAAAAALEQNEALTMLQRIADNTEEPDTVPVEPVEPSGTAIREAPRVDEYEIYPQSSILGENNES